tara:strand:+ start:232 stop:405 length:174 start_codon:yes stop_codon:yes gene_type:complete
METCSICSTEFIGFGNNSEPINDGQCCDGCNWSLVIPARVSQLDSQDISHNPIDELY